MDISRSSREFCLVEESYDNSEKNSLSDKSRRFGRRFFRYINLAHILPDVNLSSIGQDQSEKKCGKYLKYDIAMQDMVDRFKDHTYVQRFLNDYKTRIVYDSVGGSASGVSRASYAFIRPESKLERSAFEKVAFTKIGQGFNLYESGVNLDNLSEHDKK